MLRRALLLAAGLLFSACSGEKEESFSELEGGYFQALNVFDPSSHGALREHEIRWERFFAQSEARLSRSELAAAERVETGRAMLFGSLLMGFTQQATEDQTIAPSDLVLPPRYSDQQDLRAELIARGAEEIRRLRATAPLRPEDTRISTIIPSIELTLAVRRGDSLDVIERAGAGMIDFARQSTFVLFSALILMRDPVLHPMERAYMQQMLGAVCAPEQFDCNRMGPPMPAPKPAFAANSIYTEVTAPALIADFLVRRAEWLLAVGDQNPAMAPASYGEAMGRLQTAKGFLERARGTVLNPAFADYPSPQHMESRAERLNTLLNAAMQRLAGAPMPPPLPDGNYYKSFAYRAAYQCVSCHPARPSAAAPSKL